MGLNKILLQGRVVAEPELRTTQNGISVTTIRIAVERSHKNADGEKVSDFFTCVAWRGTAEFVEKYFHKGELIIVDGKLQNNEYTDKDGNKRIVAQVYIDSVFFCGGKNDANKTRQYGHSEQKEYESPTENTGQFEELTGEDDADTLPF